jgi:hypothetical protein
MRKSMLRAVALVPAVPLLTASLLVSAPAAHAVSSMPTCTAAGSTVLVEFDAIELGHTRVATFSPSSTETDVCLTTDNGGALNLAFKSNAALTPPSVTTTPGAGTCTTTIINMTAPVALALSEGTDTNSRSVCLGKDGVTTTITVASLPGVTAIPDVDVWTPAYSWTTTEIACAPQWLAYEAQPNTTTSDAWFYCYNHDHQLV